MAKGKGWSVFIALLLGVLGASVFWLYGPYLEGQVSRRVTDAVKGQPLALAPGKMGAAAKKVGPRAVLGFRYQLVTDGKNTLLADLKEGRVWRYYHHTREGGFAREDEGFLPLALHYGGKKYQSAAEVARTVDRPGSQAKTKEAETSSP